MSQHQDHGLTPCIELATLIALVASSTLCSGEIPSTIKESLAPRDYTFMWWTNGLRDPRQTFSIQTNRFAMQFDVPKFRLTHLLHIAKPAPAEIALTQKNADVFSAPNAKLTFRLKVGGKTYTAIGASRDFKNCHLVESGRFFERRLIKEIRWSQGAPALATELEIAAWPDRLTLLLRIRPEAPLENASLEIQLQSNAPAPWKLDAKATTEIAACAANEERELPLVVFATDKGWVKGDGKSPHAGVKVNAHQTAPRDAALEAVFDPVMGWHQIALRNDRPVKPGPDAQNNRIERVRLTLENTTDRSERVRLNFAKGRPLKGGVMGIVGLSAMLRDKDGYPSGLPIQISKNWHASTPRHVKKGWVPERYRGSWYRGLTMLTVPAKQKIELEYTSVNAHWGGLPAASHAQLCLVGWGSNQLWEQAAIGSWGENLCFEPDNGQRAGAITDTRPLMISGMGDKPNRKWGWTCNVGGADFLIYYTDPKTKQHHTRMRRLRHRNCPVLTETTYAGRTADTKIDLAYTISLYRTDDITRGVYRFRYDVRQATKFCRLVLFQSGSDDYSYTGERKFAWGDEKGLKKEWATQWGGGKYKTQPVEVTGRCAWFSMHEAVSRAKGKEAWANRGIIIRKWDAVLNGKKVQPWMAERGATVRGKDTSLVDLLPPPTVKELNPGDYVDAEVEHIVMPQFAADYYGPNQDLLAALKKDQNTWRMIHREAIGNDLLVEVATGKLKRRRPVLVEATGNRTAFTVTGGLGCIPMTISGLTDYRAPVLERKKGDTWQVVDQSVHGNDYWQTDHDPASGTWQISYSVPADPPANRRTKRAFRFRLGR